MHIHTYVRTRGCTYRPRRTQEFVEAQAVERAVEMNKDRVATVRAQLQRSAALQRGKDLQRCFEVRGRVGGGLVAL